MIRTLTLLAAFVPALFATAQHHRHDGERCRAHDLTEQFLLDSGMPADIARALPEMDLDLRGGSTLVVPVVFHVVWNTASENIPASAIQAVVNQLNQDYSASNSNLSGVRAPFQSAIGNANIEFCLAQFDPTGSPTDGITRTQTTATWFNPDTQPNAMKAPPLGRSPWDPTRYLNIWVCDIHSGASGGGITLGYAYLPVGGVVGTNIDGIVIDYLYGMALSSRTATHEVGHYLGLQHTWGPDPAAAVWTMGSPTRRTRTAPPSPARTPTCKCGTLTQYENFMDYSNCSAMFSNQQGNYMRSILNGVRSSLLSSTGCASVPVGYCIPTSTNGTNDGDFVNSVVLGSINNVNSGGVGAPTYTNFSGQWSTSLQRGETYTITIQSGNYAPNALAAWIDYDQNNAFAVSEKLGEFVTATAGQSAQLTFTVPQSAALGNTRLRVRGVFVNQGEPTPVEPCFNYAWGETEDYGITVTAPQTGYCIPTSTNGTSDGDFVNAVVLGSINNVNSGGVGAPTYTNFSGQWSTSLQRGQTYSIIIQSGNYAPNVLAAWIDYDQNNGFAVSEKLGEFTTTTAGQSTQITFTVPQSAALGSTRLRVRGVFVNTGEPSPVDPCFNYGYGETEDYGITITSPTSGVCIPTSINGTSDGDYINGVSLGSIVNLNSGGVDAPTYTDYSGMFSTSLARGASYSISIQGGSYSPNHYAAWIDYDQNNVFTAGEKLGEWTSTTTGQTQSINFTVPMSATLGTARLRVRGVFHNTGAPTPPTPASTIPGAKRRTTAW